MDIGKNIHWEEIVDTAPNTTSHVLYLHKTTSYENTVLPPITTHAINLQDTDYTAIDNEEQALKTVLACMSKHKCSAHKAIEKHLENLQEIFFQRMTMLLHKKNVTTDEKFVMSLTENNTLCLQCQNDEDILLDALGNDEELLNCLCSLRSFAYIVRALEYFSASQEEYPASSFPQYKVCTKGLLTHFYLKTHPK